MRILILLSSLFLFTINDGSDMDSTRSDKDHALFFAVSNYQSDGLTDLPQPIKNAEALAQELEKSYGFQTELVVDPTLKQIRDKLIEYQQKYISGALPSDGQLLVFFSGHGVKEFGAGYFLPADVDPDNVISTGLPYDSWRGFINQMNCKHILVAIDACYSVTFDPNWEGKGGDGSRFKRIGELSESEQIMAKHQEHNARLFFTSDSQEDITPGRSNFARKMLEGLSSRPTGEPFLSAEELFAGYIKKAQPSPKAGDFGKDDPRSNFLFFYQSVANIGDTQTEGEAYQDALDRNSIIAFQQFLRDYPNSDFSSVVQEKLTALEVIERELIIWEDAKFTNTRKAYKEFVDTYPNSIYRQTAELNRKNLPPDDMVLIKGGTFDMGKSSDNHRVTLRDYYIGRYEVTFDQFDAFCEATAREKPKDGGNGRGELPVCHVSWNDAVAFCNWLSEQDGYRKAYNISATKVQVIKNANGYRLPSESEWEYAARNRGQSVQWAGTSTETELFKYANCYGEQDGFAAVSPVGSLQPNEIGLYDMSGNLFEWVQDKFVFAYKDVPKDGTAMETSPRSSRSMRGGSWGDGPRQCTAIYRTSTGDNSRANGIGFRLAASL